MRVFSQKNAFLTSTLRNLRTHVTEYAYNPKMRRAGIMRMEMREHPLFIVARTFEIFSRKATIAKHTTTSESRAPPASAIFILVLRTIGPVASDSTLRPQIAGQTLDPPAPRRPRVGVASGVRFIFAPPAAARARPEPRARWRTSFGSTCGPAGSPAPRLFSRASPWTPP